MSFTGEELAAETMAKSSRTIVSGGDAVLPVMNLEALPAENMILEGAEEGGLVDHRRRKCYWLLGLGTICVAIVLGVTIPLALNRHRALNPNAAFESSPEDAILLDEDVLEQEQIQEDIFVVPVAADDDDDDLEALVQARHDAIMEQLQAMSGDSVWQDGTPQQRAANWLINEDEMMVDPETEPLRVQQRYVLTLLYFILGGDDQTSFLTSQNECSWFGVHCKPFSHTVQKLQWGNNTLEGTIPPEIGYLSALTHLNMEKNLLHGEIPTSIYSNLTKLQVLDLSDNLLTGTLDPKVKNLAESIREINLHSNQLGGELPGDGLKHLQKLQTLKLYRNRLEGTIPVELSLLTNLQRLDLDENLLEGTIPDSLGDLTQMQVLWLNANPKLGGTIPESFFANMTQLQKLVLGDLQLKGTLSDQVGNLQQLQYLQLKNNQLTGTLPESLGDCSQLIALEASYNQFVGPLPKNLAQLDHVKLLYLSHNQFQASLPTEWGQMSNLTSLVASNAQLNGALHSELGQLTNLQYLMLDRNDMKSPLPTEIGQLNQLSHLYLYDNQFHGSLPSTMGQMTNLQELIIDQNQFTGTVPDELGNLQQLNTMFIYKNHLNGTVPDPVCELRSVSSLKYLWADCQAEFNCTCCSACCVNTDGFNRCHYVNSERSAAGP